jgi:hypothetical protein
MLRWVRESVIGLPSTEEGGKRAAVVAPLPPPSNKPLPDRLAAQAKILSINIAQVQSQVDDLTNQIKQAAAAGNASRGKPLMEQRARLEKDILVLRGKHANVLQQQRAMQTAVANREQALLVQDGAQELQQVVAQTEAIDVAGAVDSMQEASTLVNEHSNLLSTDMFKSTSSGVTDHQALEDEFQRMVDEAKANDNVILPGAPTGKIQVEPSASASAGAAIGPIEK